MLDSAQGTDSLAEARRQIEICNACRYCEGYCAVFPALMRDRVFSDGNLTQLANLCHNCRGCYYACQYTEPHEFALNLPKALAEVRHDSWERFIWPRGFARLFNRSGLAIAGLIALGIGLIFWAILVIPSGGAGFYAYLPHWAMVAIFTPVFLAPLAIIALGLRGYWRHIGGAPLRLAHLVEAGRAAAEMRNLSGGQDQGCNFEDEDRFSNARRHAHQAAMWGFLLCFASTSTATVMHYLLAMPAPYGFFSLPKLFGITGGVLLCLGTAALWMLKRKAHLDLSDRRAVAGEAAFILLLFLTALTGLALYAATGSPLVAPLLAAHLGAVMALFLLMPYSKMVHGFFRFAALVREAQLRG